jgi:hypothetical protein
MRRKKGIDRKDPVRGMARMIADIEIKREIWFLTICQKQ